MQTNSLPIEDGVVQTVKNTFITMLYSTPSTARRQRSLPASLRLRTENDDTSTNAFQESLAFEVDKDRLRFETLSDACTDITSDDDASSILPISDSDDSSTAGLSPVSPVVDDSPIFGMSPASSEAGDWPYQCDLSNFEAPFAAVTSGDWPAQHFSNELGCLCEPPPAPWREQGVAEQSSMSMLATRPKRTPLSTKLSSKAVAFKPMVTEDSPKSRLNMPTHAFMPTATEESPKSKPVEEPPKPTTDKFSFVIREMVRILQNSELIAKVEVCDTSGDCSIVVQTGSADDSLTEQVLTQAKQALLEAANHSKSVYVMGYCSPNPFTMVSQGFEATLGAMENAGQACWHLFKKGFCRHDADCCKQHPTHKVPVRVLVEHATFNCSHPDEALDFKLRVADFVTTVTSALKTHRGVVQAEARRNTASKCWTIELSPSQGSKACKEELLRHAKEALSGTANSSEGIYMMGNNAKPFLSKPEGFVTVLGDMRAETRACWDLYSSGFCRRECACRWEHPTCLVPVSVVIKSSKKRITSR
jgi:hypothetical protein